MDGGRERDLMLAAPRLDERSTIGDVVHTTLAESIEKIVRYDSRLRLNADAEVVHDARVAVRRLRSNLRALFPVLDLERASELRKRLVWLQDGLSEAREADVFLALMRRFGESLPDADRPALESLQRQVDEARQAAYKRLSVMLRGERYVTLLRDAVDAAKHPPLNDTAKQAASVMLPQLVGDAGSALRKRVRRCADPPADCELHAIRIAAKRLRYLAEAIEPVAGKAARRLAVAAEQLQSILGDERDAMSACEKLRALAADGNRAFVAGELAGIARLEAIEAREAWRDAWRETKRCLTRARRSENAP